MDESRPTIAIVTPSFNQADYLERAMRSVLDQGYDGLEYVVMDGGSTDGSRAIIERFADRLSYWQSVRDGGQAAAVNEGWRRTRADILGWLNSDDFYLPGTLAYVSRFFATHPDVEVLYGTCRTVDPAGTELGVVGEPFVMATMLLNRDLVPQPSAFIRRRAVESVGFLDESLHYSLDYDLFLRLALRHEPTFVTERLAGFTIHPGAKTTKGRAEARKETYRVRLRYARGLDRFRVRIHSWLSRALHASPAKVRDWADRARGLTIQT
jgi:glycosyltransferase involved in cell wall biosynthesis